MQNYFSIRIFIIINVLLLIFSKITMAAPGEVQNIKFQSTHVINTPSQESLIEIIWDLPTGYTEVEGYYYLFSTLTQYTFDETNTAELDSIDTAYASKEYTGVNDTSINLYVAAYVFDALYEEEIGATAKFGPIRIDTESPENASVSVSQYVKDQNVNLTIGGFGNIGDATNMYISNVNYGESGTSASIASSYAWTLAAGEGRKTIFLQFIDDAGNTSNKSVYTIYDQSSPTVSMSSAITSSTNLSSIPVTLTFNDPQNLGVNEISGFDELSISAENVSATNAAVENFRAVDTDSNYTKIYAFNIIPDEQGLLSVYIPEDTINDQSGNGNTASQTLSYTFDNIRPSVEITSEILNTTNISPIPITISFNEIVSGFDISDLNVTNGSKSEFNQTDDYNYNFKLTPSSQGLVTVSIPENACSDSFGNTNTASSLFQRTYDSIAPSITITSLIDKNSTTESTPIPFTLNFSESVSGVSAGDISLTNASLDNFSGNGAIYNFYVIPSMPQGLTQVNVSVYIVQSIANDAALNPNTASESIFSFTYTTERPSVSIQAEKSQSATPDPIDITISFSRPVSGFTISDIIVNNASIDNLTGHNPDGNYTPNFTCQLTPSGYQDVSIEIYENIAQTQSGYTNTASAKFIYDINNRPSISSEAASFTIVEDGISNPIGLTLSDADYDNLSLSVVCNDIEAITICNNSNCSNTYNINAGTSQNISLTLKPTANMDSSFTATVSVSDPNGLSMSIELSFAITAKNDPPVLQLTTLSRTYTENSNSILIDENASLTDIDSNNFENGKIMAWISQNSSANDCLSLSETANININNLTVTYDAAEIATISNAACITNLIISFISQSATITVVEDIIHALSYRNISNNPSTLNRTLSIQAFDGDGDNYSSNIQTQTIQIAAINDPPQITLSSSAISDYTENDDLLIDSNISLFDYDSSDFSSGQLVVQIVSNATSNDRLGVRHEGYGADEIGVTGNSILYANNEIATFSGGTGSSPLIIEFNPLADIAKVQKLMTYLTYNNISEKPAELSKTINIYITDGDGFDYTSNTLSTNFSVVSVNDAPQVQFTNMPFNYQENDPKTFIDTELVVTDPDSNDFNTGILIIKIVQNGTQSDSLSISPTDKIKIAGSNLTYQDIEFASFETSGENHIITVTFNSSSGSVTVTELLRSIAFENTSEEPSELTRNLQIFLTDGLSSYSTTEYVLVNSVNDLPSELKLNNSNAINLDEDISVGDVVGTFSAVDLETEDESLTYSLVTGFGSDHNNYFTISENQLKTNQEIPYDTEDVLSIRVRVIDENNGEYESIFFCILPEDETGDKSVKVAIPSLNNWGVIFFLSILLLTSIMMIKRNKLYKNNIIRR